MSVTFEPQRIYVEHIPKTAGLTVRRRIEHCCGSSFVDLGVAELGAVHAIDLPTFRAIHSWHLGPGLYDRVGPMFAPVTILRAPVMRSVSDCSHHRRELRFNPTAPDPAHLEQMLPLINLPRELTPQRGFGAPFLVEHRTEMLAARADYRVDLHGGVQARRDRPMLHPPTDHAQRLRSAHRWIEQMPVVGVTEHLAESMALIAAQFGLPLPLKIQRTDRNPERQQLGQSYRDRLTPTAYAFLTEVNRTDSELYRPARERFTALCARQQARPQRSSAIAVFGRLAVGSLYRRGRQLPAQKSARAEHPVGQVYRNRSDCRKLGRAV